MVQIFQWEPVNLMSCLALSCEMPSKVNVEGVGETRFDFREKEKNAAKSQSQSVHETTD